LGYRANPITDWEHGRRFPRAEEALRAARLFGLDVPGAFSSFHPAPLREIAPGAYDLAGWIDAIRGSTPTVDLAMRAGISRFAMGRFLRGDAHPRLHHFLAIVDAATDRLPHLLAALVPITEIT
jgi:hypothetical protein